MNWKVFTLTFGICVCSLSLITVVDDALAAALRSIMPGLQWVAWVRIPSLVVCVALFVITNPANSYRLPQIETITFPVVALVLLWLLPAAYAVLIAKVWVPSLPRWIDVVAFMLTGLLAEELLFRGVVFQVVLRCARSVVPTSAWAAAVLVSAGFFAVQHLQYHGFQLTPAAAVQIAYTFGMGVVFGLLREKTGSIWPPIVVHSITNSFTLWRTFT